MSEVGDAIYSKCLAFGEKEECLYITNNRK